MTKQEEQCFSIPLPSGQIASVSILHPMPLPDYEALVETLRTWRRSLCALGAIDPAEDEP